MLDGIAPSGKELREIHEATNHSKAFNYVLSLASNKQKIINEEDVRKIHSIILNNINDYEKGNYRKVDVGIRGTNIVFARPSEISTLMHDFNDFLAKQQEYGVMHPLELASKAHLKLVDIHPFIDGNGITARLLMNSILMQNNYPALVIKVEEREEGRKEGREK